MKILPEPGHHHQRFESCRRHCLQASTSTKPTFCERPKDKLNRISHDCILMIFKAAS